MHRLYDDNGGGRNQRNGGRNRSPIPVTNKNHQMDMVRHYHKNGDVGIRVMLGNCHNAMLCIFPNIRQLHFTVFDFAEIMHPVLCADGDEIHPAIIIVPFCPCRRYAVFVTENIIIFHLFHFFLWSWRESNPRPNTLQERFLHAYPWIGFRPEDGTRLYRRPAYPLKFRHRREAAVTYLPLSDTSVRTSGRETSGETASCVSYG